MFLWGKGVASIKIELCHCTPFAFAATGSILGKDTPIPLTTCSLDHHTKHETQDSNLMVNYQCLTSTRRNASWLGARVRYCRIGLLETVSYVVVMRLFYRIPLRLNQEYHSEESNHN